MRNYLLIESAPATFPLRRLHLKCGTHLTPKLVERYDPWFKKRDQLRPVRFVEEVHTLQLCENPANGTTLFILHLRGPCPCFMCYVLEVGLQLQELPIGNCLVNCIGMPEFNTDPRTFTGIHPEADMLDPGLVVHPIHLCF